MERSPPGSESDSPLVRVLEAAIETLRAENEILRRRLAAAEARAGREAEIAGLSAITRLRARAAALGDDGLRQSRPRLARAK